jgi:hypothetical protein
VNDSILPATYNAARFLRDAYIQFPVVMLEQPAGFNGLDRVDKHRMAVLSTRQAAVAKAAVASKSAVTAVSRSEESAKATVIVVLLALVAAEATATVFELTHSGSRYAVRTLYSFKGGTDGAGPSGGLIFDKAGALYGTTNAGGIPSCRCGTVFKVDAVRLALHRERPLCFQGR